MIHTEGNTIIADTRTQKLVFTNGALTEIICKGDGKRYLHNPDCRQIPLTLVYALDTTLPLGSAEHARIQTVCYSDTCVSISFGTWNGHGELLIEEETETGAVCVTPSVHSSRPGVLACRWNWENCLLI